MISITRNLGTVIFVGNPLVIPIQTDNHLSGGVARPFYTVFCEIFLSNPALGGSPVFVDSIQVNASGKGIFDVAAILRQYAKPSLPWPVTPETQAVVDVNASVPFWLRFSDGYGLPFVKQSPVLTTDVLYAIPGGLSDSIMEQIEAADSNPTAFLQDNKIFLTSQPQGKRSKNLQPELLRFLNLNANPLFKFYLVVKQTNFSGKTFFTVLWEGYLPYCSLITFNVTPGLVFNLVNNVVEWEVFLRGEAIDTFEEVYNYPLQTNSPEPNWTIENDSLALTGFPLTVDYFGLTSYGDAGLAKILFAPLDPGRDYRVSFEKRSNISGTSLMFLGGYDMFEFEVTSEWTSSDAIINGNLLNTLGLWVSVQANDWVRLRNIVIEDVVYNVYSETATYKPLELPTTNQRCFFFQNSLGGFDTLLSVGSRTLNSEGDAVSGYVAQSSDSRKWIEPITERRTTRSVYKGSLGYFSSEELNWLLEFFMSEKKLLEIDGKLEVVGLRSNEMLRDTDTPPGKVEIEAVLGSPLLFFFRRLRQLVFSPVTPPAPLPVIIVTEWGFPLLTENAEYFILE
jgi:hypothetical protein